MTDKWYTYHSHPHKEEMLFHQIRCHNLNGFYPHLNIIPKNPRSHTTQPYFPGYLFVQVDLDAINFSVLQYMPYSRGLVSFGGEPAIVPDDLIITIQKRIEILNSGFQKRENRNFLPGDELVISGGPLEGYEALFDQALSGKDRSKILLKTLSAQTIHAEISNDLLLHKKINSYS